MADYVVVDKEKLEADLTIVADSIRAKSGTSEKLEFPQGMKSAVESISSENAKPEQEKTIDITENGTTEVTPDEGKVLSKVTVNVEVESGGNTTNELELFMLNELVEISSDKVADVKSNLFQANRGIKKISFPNATEVMNYNYYGCSNLIYVDTGKANNLRNAFTGSHMLETIILRRSDAITDLITTISNSNNMINGITKIYVPSALIETYKTATNWSPFANQFLPLEDYTVDGTTTGELDESKI